jgi:hypothetical protein
MPFDLGPNPDNLLQFSDTPYVVEAAKTSAAWADWIVLKPDLNEQV